MTKITTSLGPLYVDIQGNADEPTALLWPSLFTDHSMWRHQVAALRQQGWRTLALDPPGQGQSPGVGRRFTMDECAEAAIQVLDATETRSPALLLGTSWGGFVAPRIASRAPDRVRGMVLFATSAGQPTWFERMRARLLTKLYQVSLFDGMVDQMILSLMLSPDTLRNRPETGAEVARRLREWDRQGLVVTVQSVLVDRTPVLDALCGVKAPTSLVSGADDRLLPAVHSQRMAESLPNARHVDVPKAAHLIPLEAPDVANSLILDFVERLPRN